MLTLIAFLVVIGILVFVHELGHLIAAKSVDIEVPRFSVGFGPRVTGFRRGETEYVISALPLGGYVQMAGMQDTAALEGGIDEERPPSDRDFDAKPLWARVWVVSAGVLMNFLFAIVVFAVVAATIGEPVISTNRVAVRPVADEAVEVAPELARIPFGARVVRVGATPVENWNEIAEALATAPAGPLALRLDSGDQVSLDLPADDSARAALLMPLEPFTPAVIGEVVQEGPAELAGLRPGDRVVEAADTPIRTWSEFVELVRARPNQELPITVDRRGERVPLTLVPEPERELNDQMRRVEIGRIGAAQEEFPLDRHRLGPIAAVGEGATLTWETSTAIVRLLGDLFTGEESPRSLGGPLAIGQLSGEAARIGVEAFLRFMGFLSVNLAVLNLLPIPVLDGGQLLFLGVEAVRGRPLSVEQRLRLANVGVIIVVGIMVWAITNDFLRFFGI